METTFDERMQALLQCATDLAAQQKQEQIDLIHLIICMLLSEEIPLALGNRIRSEEHLKKLIGFFQQMVAEYQPDVEKGAETPERLSGNLTHLLELLKEADPESPITPDRLLELVLGHWDQIFSFPLSSVSLDLPPETESDMDVFLAQILSPEFNLNETLRSQPPHMNIDFTRITNQMMEVLLRRYRQNVLLYGFPGSGRSTAIRQLVHRINIGDVPPVFADRVLMEFHLNLFLADVTDANVLSKRFAALEKHLEKNPQLILLFEDLDMIMANIENAMIQVMFNHLMALLTKPSTHFVFITSQQFYNTVMNRNLRLKELLTPIFIKPLQAREATAILKDSLESLQKQYGMEIPEEWLDLAVSYADQHVRHMQFPKKALILLDIVLSKRAIRGSEFTLDDLFREAVEDLTGEKFTQLEQRSDRINHLEKHLSRVIIGQDQALKTVASHLRMTHNKLDLDHNRPDGVFLFVGPQGVGKTRMAEELSRIMYNREPHLLSPFDFHNPEEQKESGNIGYKRQTLFEKLRESSNYLILLKDVDKVNNEILELFMNASEDGVLQAPGGERIHIDNTTIVFVMDVLDMDRLRPLGFHEASQDQPENLEFWMKNLVEETFTEEFRVKMDWVVYFKPLEKEHLTRIVRQVYLPELESKLARMGHTLQVQDEVIGHIAELSYSRDFNAVNVEKKFRQLIVSRLGDLIFKQTDKHFALQFSMENDEPKLHYDVLQ